MTGSDRTEIAHTLSCLTLSCSSLSVLDHVPRRRFPSPLTIFEMESQRSRPSTPRGDRAGQVTGESHRPGCVPGTMNPSGGTTRDRSQSASQPATPTRRSHIKRAPLPLDAPDDEDGSFTRLSSANGVEWPDQSVSDKGPVPPFGIAGTSENRDAETLLHKWVPGIVSRSAPAGSAATCAMYH